MRLGVVARGFREGILDLCQRLALLGQFVGKRKTAAFPRPIGHEATTDFLESMTIAVALLLETVKRVLEPGDRPERRHGHRQIDLVVGANALKDRSIVVSVVSVGTLAIIDEIEAANCSEVEYTNVLQLNEDLTADGS